MRPKAKTEIFLSFDICSFSKGIISVKCLDFTSAGLNNTRLVFFTLKPLQISERPCMWLTSCLKGDILLFSPPITVCSWLLPLCWQQWLCSCDLSRVADLLGKLNLPVSLFYPSLSPALDSSSLVCKLAFNKRLALENGDLEVAESSYTEMLKSMKWLFSDTCINLIVPDKAIACNILTVMEILIRIVPALS